MEHTVLIIDDSEDDILLTINILAKISRGIRTHAATSGEDGLALLRGATEPPSLILLDLKMPKRDGIEVLREMGRDERLRRIPVVIFTHSKLESDEQRAVKAGAYSFLHKSSDLDQLRKNLERIVERVLDADSPHRPEQESSNAS